LPAGNQVFDFYGIQVEANVTVLYLVTNLSQKQRLTRERFNVGEKTCLSGRNKDKNNRKQARGSQRRKNMETLSLQNNAHWGEGGGTLLKKTLKGSVSLRLTR